MIMQKALLVDEIEAPLVLVHDRAVPEPGDGQIQIKVTIAGLNPHDQRSRDTGLLIADKLPAILAKDVVGTVSKLGPGVTDYEIGDRVMSLGSGLAQDHSQSGLQEYALADLVNCAKVPENVSDTEAATFPVNVSASFAALFSVLGLPLPWDLAASDSGATSILVVGGGSNCGRFTVQLAKLAQIDNIVVVGGDETELRQLGATHVIDRHSPEDKLVEKVREAAGDDLRYVVDAVNFPDGLGLALKSLSRQSQGRVARLLPIGTVEDTMGHELLDVIGLFEYRKPACVALWERLTKYVEDGVLVPTPHLTIDGLQAEVVNAALDDYRDGKSKCKPHIKL